MLDNIDNDFTLVHAEVYSFVLKQRMGHALVEIHPDVIWEPVKDTYLPKEFLYEHFQVVELGRYTVNEALYMAVETKLYGPWDRQEHKEILEKRRNEDGNRKRPV